MRRILAAKEYARLLERLSEEQTQKAAAAVAHSARELMARYGLNRLVVLFDESLRPVALRSLELVLGIGVEAAAAALNTDDLPDLAGSLICDLLLDPVGRGTVREKRAAWIDPFGSTTFGSSGWGSAHLYEAQGFHYQRPIYIYRYSI